MSEAFPVEYPEKPPNVRFKSEVSSVCNGCDLQHLRITMPYLEIICCICRFLAELQG